MCQQCIDSKMNYCPVCGKEGDAYDVCRECMTQLEMAEEAFM